MKVKTIIILVSIVICFSNGLMSQNIIPTPTKTVMTNSDYVFEKKLTIAYDVEAEAIAQFLEEKIQGCITVDIRESNVGDIVFTKQGANESLGKEGYLLRITDNEIKIISNSKAGWFYGVQSFLQLLPTEVQAGKPFNLTGFILRGIEIIDYPKYTWRSFMLDSGRQYQSPEFIKQYLDYMALLKMNVFHWHLTEGQGWRIEIKKYPKLTEVGSKVSKGLEQHGFYTQEDIKDIVAYAKKLHITVVPEIDVPGHSEAALMAYPELSCFGNKPETVMGFSANLFCGGQESTYQFLEGILDEVCELFPSQYIHLGGDEAPKANWNKCPHCISKIKEEGLLNAHDLQIYFSSRLAKYLKSKHRKVIFWGDVVYDNNEELPDNVIIHWWNWRKHKDETLKKAIIRGHQIICNTNYYTYLNFPVTPWSKYNKNRTFDMKKVYEENPSDIDFPNALVLGMGCSLWTDWYVQEHMIDQRVFPRIFVLAEQMWSTGKRLPFSDFYKNVKAKYTLLRSLGINYGPAMIQDVSSDYSWD